MCRIRSRRMPQEASVQGIVTRQSPYPFDQTVARLENVLRHKGLTIFAHIDQKAAAESAGLAMPPTVLIIFGDPRAGTPLMLEYPSLAMDLPLKALVREEQGGVVSISYNSPEYLQKRHGLKQAPFGAVGMLIEAALQQG